MKLLTQNPLPNKTTFVLGATGSGKSVLCAQLLRQYPRYVVFDVKNEFVRVDSVSGVRVSDFIDFCAAMNDAEPRIIFDPCTKYFSEMELALQEVLFFMLRFQEQNLGTMGSVRFYLEELNRFVHSRKVPPVALSEIVERGRGYGIEKLFVGQWFGTVPTSFRDSFSELYVFAHADRAALSLFEDYGLDSDVIRNLPQHVCLFYDRQRIERVRCVATQTTTQKEQQTLCTEAA